jgi:hypothetical protein
MSSTAVKGRFNAAILGVRAIRKCRDFLTSSVFISWRPTAPVSNLIFKFITFIYIIHANIVPCWDAGEKVFSISLYSKELQKPTPLAAKGGGWFLYEKIDKIYS